MIFFIVNSCIQCNIIHIFLFVFIFLLVGVNSGDLILLFGIASKILANDVKGEVDIVVEANLFEFGELTLLSITSKFLAIDVLSSNVVSWIIKPNFLWISFVFIYSVTYFFVSVMEGGFQSTSFLVNLYDSLNVVLFDFTLEISYLKTYSFWWLEETTSQEETKLDSRSFNIDVVVNT